MNYQLPNSLIKFMEEQKRTSGDIEVKWEKILEKVTLNNIHTFCDASKGKEPLGPTDNINAEHLMNLDSKTLLLTGKPN